MILRHGWIYDTIKVIMLRKIFLFFCAVVLVPQLVCGETYTLDKRKYVDDKWGTDSYKHILKMIRKGEANPFCVAHVIKERVVFAKHCINNPEELKNIDFVAHNGYVVPVMLGKDVFSDCKPYFGGYDEKKESSVDGDWVVLCPGGKDNESSDRLMNFLKDNSLNLHAGAVQDLKYAGVVNRVSSVGFDNLKILSDEEIKKIRLAFYNYLYDKNNMKPVEVFGMPLDYETSVKVYSAYTDAMEKPDGVVLIQDFIKNMEQYGISLDVFKDSGRLKEYVCKDYKKSNLQAFHMSGVIFDCPVMGYTADGAGVYAFWRTKENKEYPFFYGLLRPAEEMKIGAKKNSKGVLVPVQNFMNILPQKDFLDQTHESRYK